MARWIALAGSCFALLAASCGAGTAAGAQEVSWTPYQAAAGVVDLAGPRTDGRLVVAMGGGLQLFRGGGLQPFTHQTGAGGYVPLANESYIALAPKVRLRKAHCSFHRDEMFALAENPNRIVRITRSGMASDFVSVPSPFLGGITFDRVGTFGHRLLVSGTDSGQSTLYAIDCRGWTRKLADHGPNVEGGIEVAPRSFGRFGGRLIGLDEMHGPISAFKPDGSSTTLATPAPPAGGAPR